MNTKRDDEIDLIEIFKKIYNSKKVILYSSIAFTLIGISISLISPIKYSSSTIFITQNQENTQSNLSGVASLVGINLGTSSLGGDIPSAMYPLIGESPKFKRLLLNTTINNKKNLTLKKFLIEHHKIDEKNDSFLSLMEIKKPPLRFV